MTEHSPWDSTGLQLVGDVYVPGPDIKLPLPQPQDATQHRARVDPDAHVNVMFCPRAHVSNRHDNRQSQHQKTFLFGASQFNLKKGIFKTVT